MRYFARAIPVLLGLVSLPSGSKAVTIETFFEPFGGGTGVAIGTLSFSVSDTTATFDLSLTAADWRVFGFSFLLSPSINPNDLVYGDDTSLSLIQQIPGTDHYSVTLRFDIGPPPFTEAQVLSLPTSAQLTVSNLPVGTTEQDFIHPNDLVNRAYGLTGEFEVIVMRPNEAGLSAFTVAYSSETPVLSHPVDTPEPSTFAVFTLGFIALALGVARENRRARVDRGAMSARLSGSHGKAHD